jgi:hypothetical protein
VGGLYPIHPEQRFVLAEPMAVLLTVGITFIGSATAIVSAST